MVILQVQLVCKLTGWYQWLYEHKTRSCLATALRLIHCGVVAKVIDSDIVVSEFKLQSRYYVLFRTNTFENGIKPLIPQAMS